MPLLTLTERPRAHINADFETILRGRSVNGELVHLTTIGSRPARHTGLSAPVTAQLRDRIPLVDRLWTHQAAAIDLVREGRSVVLATGTASGKSLAYQVPLADAALRTGGRSTSLLLFPTKALAQDQLRSLASLAVPGLVPVVYDGDTDPDARRWARRHATCVLTNPDMLHAGILPFHGRWATFLRRLELVVIDELHVYRGVFGSHLAQIIRRLTRLCVAYGGTPTFVFASATIGRPDALASELIGGPVALVDDDASPSGERTVAVWKPSNEATATTAATAPTSGNSATARLLADLVEAGYRSIAFARSRRATEVVAARARRLVADGLQDAIRPYRGGYLPAERRAIERQLFDGTLRGVVATSALELGVDIGGLDACISNGFPGTIASFRQQIGRVGRSTKPSLAVLVIGDDALDHWYGNNPEVLLRRGAEPVVINVANPFVLEPHIECAAHEIPLVAEDADRWAGDQVDAPEDTDRLGAPDVTEAFHDAVRHLVRCERLHIVNGRAVYSGRGSPAHRMSLRSDSGAEFRVVDHRARLIGTVDASRAFSTLHCGALYLHQGQQYRVQRLDLDDRAAWVEPVHLDEYTIVRSDADLTFIGVHMTVRIGALRWSLGDVEVTEQVVAFERKRTSTGAVLSLEALDLPATTLRTRAFWYEVPDDVLAIAGLHGGDACRVPGSLHAAEHAGIAMLPLFAICDRWDVGGVSTAAHGQSGEATVAIYDAYTGGAGIAELGYGAGRRHLEETLRALMTCSCADGCPSCVQSPKCGNGNEPLDKPGAIAFLQAALR